jgi:hypothetical protein
MAIKKTVFSKINVIGSVRQSVTTNKTLDSVGESGREISCSIDNDNKTTYVQQKEWDIELNDFKFPPYVECDYVV